MKTGQKRKNLFGEQSVEAKPRSVDPEPTTIKAETKKLWDNMLKTTGQDVFGGSLSSFSEQLLGGPSEQQMREGEELMLNRQVLEDSKKPQITEEFIEYRRTVVDTENRTELKTEGEIKQAVEQIQAEIKRLMQTSKIVERTVKDATAEHAPVKPGKYHLSFFEFVLGVIRDATRKLEDTANFGAVFTSKKQQSKYWNTFKQQGTTFGLSGERTTATQTG